MAGKIGKAGLKINIGCHWEKPGGFLNVDIDPETMPDIIWDLNKIPWKPFAKGSAVLIRANHVLEHLGHLDGVFAEFACILQVGGEVEIAVPYVTNAYSLSLMNYSKWHNHTHVGFIHDSFDALCKVNGLEVAGRTIMLPRPYRYIGLQWLFNRFPKLYNHFLLFMFPAYEVRVRILKAEEGKGREYHN